MERGDAWLAQGKMQEASECFRLVLAVEPRNAEASRKLTFALNAVGNTLEAEQVLGRALVHEPQNAETHYMLGTLAASKENYTEAGEHFLTTVRLVPDFSRARQDLFHVLCRLDRIDEAEALAAETSDAVLSAAMYRTLAGLYGERRQLESVVACFEKVLAMEPDALDALVEASNALLQLNRHEEAISCMRTALRSDQADAALCIAIAGTLKQLHQYQDALAGIERALELDPSSTVAHRSLAQINLDMGHFDAAIASFKAALALSPQDDDLYMDLATAFQLNGNIDDAIVSLQRALTLNSKNAVAHFKLGNIYGEINRFDESANSFRRAIGLQQDFAEAHNNLGLTLSNLGDPHQAISHFRVAIELRPAYADAHFNLGNSLKHTGSLREAIGSLRRAIELRPDFLEAKWNLGLALLTDGKYREGWPYHELRTNPDLSAMTTSVPDLPYAQWQGEPLQGKSLVIWPEYGSGDFFQFIRYAALLKQRGADHISVLCPRELQEVLETASGVDSIYQDASRVPMHDYWSLHMSLPLHCDTTLDSIPAELPYLYAKPERTAKWRGRIECETFKVGLVWKGNPKHSNDSNRSLPDINTLAPLWEVEGVRFFSLQKGQGEDEVGLSPAVDLGRDVADFADTAAIVDQLDLIICVDTSVAHLAGALGKRCWILLPLDADWRWLQDRSDSPWYPGAVRLFRQQVRGQWDKVVADVKTALVESTQYKG
jgi:tetratricopeptide (TPR) repeat protein